tara:strand:+ start:281 stop:622 length:342 start_codon:yes stop_codon:yes gene_type:complete
MSNKVTVKININGVIYPVSCQSGEETRLIKSSEEVNKVIEELSNVSDLVGETRLLAMTSLILADKLIEKENINEENIKSNMKIDNLSQMSELMDWLSKATERMNKVAKLLENK